MDPPTLRQILRPYSEELSLRQLEQFVRYLNLLTKWNRHINLTSIKEPEECVRRHFGESLWVLGSATLSGDLLDIGSGAGFPGLVLKIARPGIFVVLLERIAKKRAFLKEVIRECDLDGVEVHGGRIEEFPRFDWVTMRAVGGLDEVLPSLWGCLQSKGAVALWLTRQRADELARSDLFRWSEPLAIPATRDRVIIVGRKLVAQEGPNTPETQS